MGRGGLHGLAVVVNLWGVMCFFVVVFFVWLVGFCFFFYTRPAFAPEVLTNKLRNLGFAVNRSQTQGCSEHCVLKACNLDLGPSSFDLNASFMFNKYHSIFCRAKYYFIFFP